MQLKDFTELIVDVGFGSSIDWTEEDYVENGFTLVDLYVKQFGPDDAEDILMTLVYRVGDYLEAFEETDEETIHFLRDAVFSCPDGGVREFYETIRDGKGKAWPDGLEEQAGVL